MKPQTQTSETLRLCLTLQVADESVDEIMSCRRALSLCSVECWHNGKQLGMRSRDMDCEAGTGGTRCHVYQVTA